jgi:polyphosphate kinase 2 (PPK2 family)
MYLDTNFWLVIELLLLQVADVAREKWIEVGIALQFRMEELTDYKERESKFLQRRLLRMLEDWKKKDEHPTVEALVEACTTAGVGGAVKRVLGLIG